MPDRRRLQAFLVRLLPAAFRERYGDDMLALSDEQRDAARARGRIAILSVAVRTTLNLLWCIPREHWRAAGNLSTEQSMQTFWFDLRFAARAFVRQRGATALLLVTLTLAIASNTAVFTLLDGIFLRPFPFRDASRLVYLNEQAPKWNLEFTGINYPDFVQWRDHTRAFDGMALISPGDFNVANGDATERVRGAAVTWDMARVLDIRPVMGRLFTATDDRPGGPNVVMIGYQFWRSHYAGAHDVVGRTLRIDSAPYTIVGVLPESAAFPGDVQLWTPLDADPAQPYQSYSFDGVGRLKPGVTLAAARADLMVAHEPLWRKSDTAHVVSPRIMPLRDRYAADYTAMGTILGLGVFLVLLIACGNVAGAMLARATLRRRELAVRVALGASGHRIARQLLTEALLLTAVAGVCGTALGWWGIRTFAASSADLLPIWVHLDFDLRLALFSTGLIGTATILFGALPALAGRRQGIRDAASVADRRSSATRHERRTLDALVVAEIALASVLLVGSGLLVRAYQQLRATDPGFRADGAIEFRIAPPQATYANGTQQRQLYERLIDGLNAIPGVTSAGAVTCPPLTCHWGNFFQAEGEVLQSDGANPVVLTRVASPDYFRTMQIRFVQGRAYAAAEQRPFEQLFPLVINEEFAHLHWPDLADPVGKRVRFRNAGGNNWMTVVGVVHDVRHYGLAEPMRPGIYMPMSFLDSTHSLGGFAFVVRTAANPAALGARIRSLLRTIDPELPVYQLQTLRDALDASLLTRRSLMLVLAAFAGIAFVLAVGGIYAVLSYVVGRRRREIGIRMALGARRWQVVRMVLLQGATLVGAGLLIGLPIALAGGRALGSQLAGVDSIDPLIYIATAAVLAVTGVAAAIVPARRAASVSPSSVLADGT